MTGLKAYFNYLQTDSPVSETNFIQFVTNVDRRRSIHVGNSTFHQDDQVETMMINDVFQSIPSEQLIALFDNYKVLVYNGLLDIICAESLTMNWIDDLQWSRAAQYKKTVRQIWRVDSKDKQVAGYMKIVDRFMLVAIRNAGHMAPTDQPRATLDMIDRFISLT